MCPVITHGDSQRGNIQRLYRTWCNIISRCENKNIPTYENYGKRGISICSSWRRDYQSFKSWAIDNGYSDNLTIERVDNDGDYSPENCKWVTRKEQNRNKRNVKLITAFGETKSIPEWAEDKRCFVSFRTLRARISEYLWDVEIAITKI